MGDTQESGSICLNFTQNDDDDDDDARCYE
jgi:hypothetical protein